MKPAGPVFDRSWRQACGVKRINRRLADSMIKSHYIGQWPKMPVLVLGLYRKSKLLGVITYSAPHSAVVPGVAWELSRLWIDDSVPANAESYLIGQSVKYIKKNHHFVQTLFAFADPGVGHKGIVYRASNWKQQLHVSKNLYIYKIAR